MLLAPERPSPHRDAGGVIGMATDKRTPPVSYKAGDEIRCHKCGELTILSPVFAKKRDYICVPCSRRRNREYVARNRERFNAYNKQWRQENRDRFRLWDRAYRQRDKERTKQRARDRVLRAVRSGRLARGLCEVCGAAETQAHHDDYSQPLVVRWRCQEHHAQLHRDVPRNRWIEKDYKPR